MVRLRLEEDGWQLWDESRYLGAATSMEVAIWRQVLALQEQLQQERSGLAGHEQPCYYCGQKCDALAADPGRWPTGLCHSDEPGVVKWHHTSCVSERLEKRETK